MRDIRDSRIRTLIVIVIVLLALAYLYFIAPGYNKNIGELRMQSKLMQFDITTINEMSGDETKLDLDIEASGKSIDDIKKSASVGAEDVSGELFVYAKKSNISILSSSFEDAPDKSIPPAIGGPVLNTQRITITSTGDYDQGAAFMKRIEDSDTASIAVESFAYSGADEANETSPATSLEAPEAGDPDPTWIFSLILYYYEQE
jgi:hypothetical protein